MYVVSAVALTLLGFGDGFALLLALAFVTGATTMGAQNISYAFVSQYYPSAIRSTAIGLASGVGRLGAIFGPTFGGLMLGTELPIEASFVAFAVPGLFAAAAFLFVPLGMRPGRGRAALAGPAADGAAEAVRHIRRHSARVREPASESGEEHGQRHAHQAGHRPRNQ